MIVAIVCLLLTTTICFSLARIALSAQQQAERQGWRQQSVWLAESALAQAALRLRSDADFAGDEWTVEDVGTNAQTGRITVRIADVDESPRQRTITATADFPDDTTDRVRTMRTLTLTLPEP